ncbi:MAG: hypothetical protein RLZZ04_2365 [Cyanobacteriota bacterium]
MSRNIRLFPSYSQTENQTTNHCLLILKMLYEENPNFLSEVLTNLIDESFSGSVGVQFIQQKKSSNLGIPDGEITQDPFSILIETKLGCDFDKQQLVNHLNILKPKHGQKVLLALGNFEQDIPTNAIFSEVEQRAKEDQITFLPISFEQFIESIELDNLSKNLADAVADLREYFDENALLPSWKYRLDVVSCNHSFDSVIQHKIYTCPTKGGAYTHRRSLYFGIYRDKRVEQVAKITGVVDLDSADEQTLVWNNDHRTDNELKQIAIKRFQPQEDISYPTRVFILDDFYETSFKKESSGGMWGKRYFDIRKLDIGNAQDLASKLQDKTWNNY